MAIKGNLCAYNFMSYFRYVLRSTNFPNPNSYQIFKGLVKVSKGFFGSSNSSKKRMKEFILVLLGRKNKLVCSFFGRIVCLKKTLRLCLTVSFWQSFKGIPRFTLLIWGHIKIPQKLKTASRLLSSTKW